MSKKIKIAALFLAICLIISGFIGCKKEDAKFVGKVNGETIPDGLFMAMFNETLDTEYNNSDSPLDFTLQGEAFFEQIKEKKTESGKTYLEYFKEESLTKAKQVIVAKQMAVKSGKWLSNDKIKEYKAEAKADLEKYLTTYNNYGYSFGSINELAGLMFGMTANDYIEYYALNKGISEYETAMSKEIDITEEALKKFYEDNIDLYRVVKVRHSLFKTEGLSDDEAEELLKTVEGYIQQYNDGAMTMDEIVAKSEDKAQDGTVNNDGYYEVVADGSYVKEFEEWAIAQKEVSDKLEVVETTFGYHVMQCVEIKSLDDETVKKNAEEGYVLDAVAAIIIAESEKTEYNPANIDNKYIEKIILRSLTGDFDDEDEDATAGPSATPIEYDDAPADKTEIAKLGDKGLYKTYYKQFYSQAFSEIIVPELDIPDDMEVKDQYEYIKNFITTEKEEGVTYSKATKDRALELLLQFIVTRDIATGKDYGYTEEEIKNYEKEIDAGIDQMLSYYGSYYGVSTRDEFSEIYLGMKVSDYKLFYIDQLMVSEYSQDEIKKLTATDDEVSEYYNLNVDQYRTVTIRRILRLTVDSKGNPYTDEQKAEVYDVIKAIEAKINSGDSLAALAKAWSEDENVDTDEGLVDLTKLISEYDESTTDWIFTQTQIGAMTIVETEDGYELIVIEGITTLTESQGTVYDEDNVSSSAIKESISTVIVNDKYEKTIEEYIAENNLSLTDISWEIIQTVEDEYLSYEEETEDK